MITPIMPTYNRSQIALERGEGAYVWDVEGRRYLDFASGIAVSALGHGHPHVVDALCEQARKIWHTSNLYRIPQQERLASRLTQACFADTVFFTNSGAEAIECAIKTARRYQFASDRPERYRIITFQSAFHGRTLACIAATDQEKLRSGFAPLPDWFDVVPFGDLAATQAAIGDQTGAILVEPVQGEGGIKVADQAFLAGLRALADKHGLMLIFDEIQCGMGRTGALFAYEHFGVRPDIMATAKGIGAGFPLGACLATEKAAKGMVPGTHGSTYGGNPLACAVGNAVLDVVLEPSFLAQVNAMATRLRGGLEDLAGRHPRVLAGVRGLGMMLGVKLKVPVADMIAAVRKQALLAAPAGDNVLRLLPPLVIGEAEIAEALEKLSAAASELEAASAA